MEFFHLDTHIDFMRIRFVTALMSAALCFISLFSLFYHGLNWGLDFTGGIVVELEYPQDANLSQIRTQLRGAHYEDAIVQSFGSTRSVMVRLAPRAGVTEQAVAEEILTVLKRLEAHVELRRVDAVGAQVGRELAEQGWLAIGVALLAIMIYIGLRFELRFALSAAVALAHDPILILGIFSFYQIEFDLTTLAAILAVIGYSLNDTIVVFDRVKENFITLRRANTIEVVNSAINQTLSRTIMTSCMTLFVVVALLLFGGPTLFGFSIALVVGIVIGTYSSIYVAGALAVALGLKKADLVPSKDHAVDALP
jgi:preprotein translocase subunit SecF